ncbi:MAG: cytosine permease [Dehalococcoidales bacterium]|nr:cytosine permease [Dehalococcoidales bacterium]
MNEYLPQQYYRYNPSEYQTQFWQAAFSGIVGIAMLIAVGAWAFSLVRKAFRGEEVEFPL